MRFASIDNRVLLIIKVLILITEQEDSCRASQKCKEDTVKYMTRASQPTGAVGGECKVSRESFSHGIEMLIAHGIVCMHHRDPSMLFLQFVLLPIRYHPMQIAYPKFLPPPRLRRGLSSGFDLH